MQELLESLQDHQSPRQVPLQRAELQNRLCVALTFSEDSGCFLRHLEPVIDSWQVHLPERHGLVATQRTSVHEREAAISDTNLVVLIVKGLVRGAVHIRVNLLFCEHMAVVRLHHCMLDRKLAEHVIELAHELLPRIISRQRVDRENCVRRVSVQFPWQHLLRAFLDDAYGLSVEGIQSLFVCFFDLVHHSP